MTTPLIPSGWRTPATRQQMMIGMLPAFGPGALAQSSLLLAGLVVCWVTVPRRLVGVLAGFGAAIIRFG